MESQLQPQRGTTGWLSTEFLRHCKCFIWAKQWCQWMGSIN